jgi:DNA-binding NarL/FixJ family response regulator
MSNYLGARIRVAFVETDVIFRTGLRALLEPRNDFEWVGEAASLSDFRARYAGVGIQVIMIDAELLQELDQVYISFWMSAWPQAKFLLLVPNFKSAMVPLYLKWGFHGVVNKWNMHEEAVTAFRQVFFQHAYLHPNTKRMLDAERRTIKTLERITAREIDVIRGICQEKTCREIAHDLQISPRTVETHKMRIIEKLDLRNTAGIIVHAVRLGIIP